MADENPNPIRAGAASRLQALTGGTLAPSHGIGKPFRQSVRTPGGLRQQKEQTVSRKEQAGRNNQAQKERLVSHQEQSHATAHMARGGKGWSKGQYTPKGPRGGVKVKETIKGENFGQGVQNYKNRAETPFGGPS